MNISDKMGGSFKSIEEWRNEGNEFFKAGNFSSAISSYTAALTLLTHSLQTGRSLQDSMESQSNLAKPIPNQELKSIILRNRSQCHLKLEDWRSAEQDASSGTFIYTRSSNIILGKINPFDIHCSSRSMSWRHKGTLSSCKCPRRSRKFASCDGGRSAPAFS